MSESTGKSTTLNEQPNEPVQASPISPHGESDVDAKQVPVSEAIRYRKRAQAAEKELSELKQAHEKQADELAGLKEQMEQIKAEPSHSVPVVMTQGVKQSRTSGARNMLQNAARQAADSGSRADVHAYLRLRRNYV